jgi:thioredoxin-related protein
MREDALNNLQVVLNKMAEFELAIAELYLACSQIWPDNKYFWILMERCEVKHAHYVDKIKKMVKEKPEVFELGRPFKPAAIQLSITGVRWHLQRVKNKEITEKNMLFISRDTEQSFLQSQFGEMVKTSNIEFQSIMNEILSDTEAHREFLNDKIKEGQILKEDHLTAAEMR